MNWFFSDEFEKFYKRVERLQKILKVVDKELLIDHFVESKRHLRQIKGLIPKLIRSYRKELEVIDKIKESEYKDEMEKFSSKLNEELSGLKSWLDNALLYNEEILKKRVLEQSSLQKEKLGRIIVYLTQLLTNAQRNAFKLVKLERAWKKEVRKKDKEPVTKIPVVGKLNNGWPLANIQSVVLDLGGVVKRNPGRKHEYKIFFPKHRSIPLATSTPPFLLVKQIKGATGVDKKVLVASFNYGELVSA